MKLTWKEVAIILGRRMVNHAFCYEKDHATTPNPECPFCQDIEAYRLFMEKFQEGK